MYFSSVIVSNLFGYDNYKLNGISKQDVTFLEEKQKGSLEFNAKKEPF